MKNYKLVMEIISLAVLINENTEMCTFVDFSGHVQTIEVRIYPSKSDEYVTKGMHKIYSVSSYYSEESWMKEGEVLAKLQSMKQSLSDYLLGIYKEGE